MQVWASVNEADIGRIRPGQPVRFTVDAFPGETFRGKVAQIRLNATMTQNVVTYTVVVTTDNPDGKLLPYLTANLQVRDRPAQRRAAGAQRGAALEAAAASRSCPEARAALRPRRHARPRERRTAARVWVAGASASCGRSPVQVGLSDGLMTEIASGDVHEGERSSSARRARPRRREERGEPVRAAALRRRAPVTSAPSIRSARRATSARARQLIRLEDIHKTYHLGEVDVPVLHGVSLSIERGEMVALMGASGSGKTTLMNILGCLDRPTSGQYWLDGQEMSPLSADRAGAGAQPEDRLRLPELQPAAADHRPRERAACRWTMRRGSARSSAAAVERARALLERVGLGDRLDHEPSQMSAASSSGWPSPARWSTGPRCSWPTSRPATSTRTPASRSWRCSQLNAEEGITVVLVTHDPEVARHAHRVIRIDDGLIAEDQGTRRRGPRPARPTPTLPAVLGPRAPARRSPRGASAARCDGRSRALRRNMMRSALTALGIIIGVGAVIAMMEIGEGSRKSVEQTIASMGANTILVLARRGLQRRRHLRHRQRADAHAAGRRGDRPPGRPASTAVAPVVRARTQVIYGNRNWVPVYIYGTTPAFLARPRLGGAGRGRDVHRPRRAQRQQGLPDRPDDRARAVPGAGRRSARRSASRTSPSA